jgi:hypothetical protein
MRMPYSIGRYIANFMMCIVAMGWIFGATASAQAPNQAVDQFLADPNQLLQAFPNGGARLISVIRDTVASHPEAFQRMVDLLKNAKKEQQAAFGSAFGQAAQLVVRTNQPYATQIQQAIADSGSEEAKIAFAAVVGDVAIGAADGGGGSGGSGGGGIGSSGFAFGGASTGGTQANGGLHYQTLSLGLLTGGGVGGASQSADSVSPH